MHLGRRNPSAVVAQHALDSSSAQQGAADEERAAKTAARRVSLAISALVVIAIIFLAVAWYVNYKRKQVMEQQLKMQIKAMSPKKEEFEYTDNKF